MEKIARTRSKAPYMFVAGLGHCGLNVYITWKIPAGRALYTWWDMANLLDDFRHVLRVLLQ